ncbi:MAG TPA: cupin domain-containing protein [Streptosporangiaceae bacterium]|nr:cupin domain-containing protein [Streptosporangiaceae bacterium]
MTDPPAADPAGLLRRLVRVAPRSRLRGRAGSGGELWFLISGRGRLAAGDAGPGGLSAAVGPDTGVWLPPRSGYRLEADPGAGLAFDAVTLPPAKPGSAAAAGPPCLSELRDCAVERTGDRRFRVLLGPGRGCAAATQFVGEIPPGKAPEHSHPYDEMVLVLEGTGVAHARGGDRPLAPGARVHLPPGLPHCLENTGPGLLVVLGVFHPGGSPAVKQESSR